MFNQNPIEGIKARISDKINRIASKGIDDKTEDSVGDLIGYLIHLKIMLNNERLIDQELRTKKCTRIGQAKKIGFLLLEILIARSI